jgi:hypothetical protein
MSNVLISPNMNLPSPIPATTPGPEWSYDIASCLSIIDSHDHSNGKGVQISPAGMNINADLSFNSNNATLLKTARFSPQVSAITASSPNVGCLYVVGNELYYNDVNGGHQVPITDNGSVNAGAGSITGLPSGTASASYSAGTFTWQSATNTAANMDMRSAILRNSTASSKGLTVNPPAAMAADIAITLPTPPASSAFLTIDSSGNFGTGIALSGGISSSNIAAGGVARSNLVAVGQQFGTNSNTSNYSGASFQDVTGFQVTLTTSGRPVMLMLVGQPNVGIAGQHVLINLASAVVNIQFVRGSTVVSTMSAGGFNANAQIPPAAFTFLDTPSAGTYTYKVQVACTSGQMSFVDVNFVAYEL